MFQPTHKRLMSPSPKSQVMFASAFSWIGDFVRFLGIRSFYATATLLNMSHDTFRNLARSIAPGSRPVARVHTGATGTLNPVSRDHLATWNERRDRSRSIAIGRDRSRPVDSVVWTLDRALATCQQISRCWHTPSWSTSSPLRHMCAFTCLQ